MQVVQYFRLKVRFIRSTVYCRWYEPNISQIIVQMKVVHMEWARSLDIAQHVFCARDINGSTVCINQTAILIMCICMKR